MTTCSARDPDPRETTASAVGERFCVMRVHLAIVSEQLLPTVIPCLMAPGRTGWCWWSRARWPRGRGGYRPCCTSTGSARRFAERHRSLGLIPRLNGLARAALDKKGNELAYKVKSLGDDIRGLFGNTWVLAAQEPTSVLRDRAKQAGFLVIDPRFLGSLPQWVGLWKKGQSPGARG
jgi:hypothetical protein